MNIELPIDEFKELCIYIKDIRGIENIDLRDISDYYDDFVAHKSSNNFELEYEHLFKSDEGEPCPIDGWVPIATNRIKNPEKIPEYIKNGILRKIEFYKILDCNDIEMPEHHSGRRRTILEAERMLEGLNLNGEHAPYRMEKE